MPAPDLTSPRNAPPEPECQAALSARGSGQLGLREREILEVVWAGGSGTVQQVSSRLSIALAYTTVMTTLDRLFKKGLLHRVKQDRAFLYSPAVSLTEVERLRARSLVERFFNSSRSSQDLLLSCLVDVLGQYDESMLSRLDEKITQARLALHKGEVAPGEEPLR